MKPIGLRAVCDQCDWQADALHFVPWCVPTPGKPIRIELGCSRHDPGGYFIRLSDLNLHPDRWIHHLRESKSGPAHKMLLGWIVDNLGHDPGLKNLYKGRPYAVKWERPR
jgi:hypothetical protein